MTHTQARELIAPYSLGVLDGEELSAIEEHLAGCAFCASLASEAGQVVGYLAYAAPPRRPPQNGLRRLLGEVSAIEQQAGAEVDPAPPAATADDGGPEVAARRRRPAWLTWPSLVRLPPVPVAAALVLALGLGVWNLFLMDHLEADRAEMDELKGRVTRQSELLFLMTSNESVSRPLQATSFAPDAQIRVVIDKVHHKAVVMANRLPRPAPGWVYQVWLGAAESRFPAGRLIVDDGGNAECSLRLPSRESSYDWAWITVEPEQGTPLPVSTGVARGNL